MAEGARGRSEGALSEHGGASREHRGSIEGARGNTVRQCRGAAGGSLKWISSVSA